MDFAFTEEQEALRDLARRILEDHVTHDRLKAIEKDAEWFDRKTWEELAKAQLLGIAVPAQYGGGGCGIIELCLLLEEIGRTVAPLPAFATLVLGALPIARYGSEGQRQQWLPGVARGETILSAALVENEIEDPAEPATLARREGAGWRLDGAKVCVPAAHLARRVLVPARAGADIGIFLLDPQARGVTMHRQVTTSGEPQFHLELSGALVSADEVLGELSLGREIAGWIREHALVGLCAIQTGVTDRALRITAEYTSKREQFGKPLATFQAVAQRAADSFIDVEAIRWTMWQAAWRLSAGLAATEEITVAKFWASDAAYRVAYAAQHLHGGIGLDVDYPVHRYFLWAKQIELTLGSGTRQLLRLGAAMADWPAEKI
jgi:alkylation response protein AidB-like acyl-CoA dehydrogenase